jgi:hypothetical protein
MGSILSRNEPSDETGAVHPRRLSHVIAVPATALVLIDAVAIVLLVSGAVSTVRLGFQTIRRHDIFGAAEIGALLSAIIVVSA